MSDTANSTPAIEAPVQPLTREQGAALAAAVTAIACQVTGSGQGDAETAFTRLRLPAECKRAIASITAP